jgi:hypothetical protein
LPPKLFSVLLERTRRRPADFKAGSHSQCSSDCGIFRLISNPQSVNR